MRIEPVNIKKILPSIQDVKQSFKLWISDTVYAYCYIDVEDTLHLYNQNLIQYSTYIKSFISSIYNDVNDLRFHTFIFDKDNIQDYKFYLIQLVNNMYEMKYKYCSYEYDTIKIIATPELVFLYEKENFVFDEYYNKITFKNTEEFMNVLNDIKRYILTLVKQQHDIKQKISTSTSLEELKEIEDYLMSNPQIT